MSSDDHITKREGAAYLKVSLPTFNRMVREGVIPSVRVGKKKTIIRRSDILDFVEKRYVRGTETSTT